MADKTPEEVAAEKAAADKAAADEAAKEEEEEEEQRLQDLVDDDGFDKERALSTIRTQRAVEKKQKAELADLRAFKADADEAEAEKEEADKDNEQKLAESNAENTDLKAQLTERDVRADFERQAIEEAGIDPEDLELAYLAAKEQGLLGDMDPKTGQVGAHDFDTLAERYPALGGEGTGRALTGDAGRTGRGSTSSVGKQFDAAIRDVLRK